MQNISDSSRKNQLWSAIMITLTVIFISGLIVINFLFSEEKYTLSLPLIILICLLVLLVLSDSYSSFTIFNLFKASKNEELKIDKLNKEEKEAEEAERDKEVENAHKHIDNDKFGKMILTKYYGQSKIDKIMFDIKISDEFINVDSISNKPIFFDAYLKERNQETFIIIRRSNFFSMTFHDSLYVKTNKLLSYRKNSNKRIKLILIISNFEAEEKFKGEDLFFKYFEPAIKNKLLKIENISYNSTELEQCLKK